MKKILMKKKRKLKKVKSLKNKIYKLKLFFIQNVTIEELFMILDKVNQRFFKANIEENVLELTFKEEISKEVLIDLINDMIDDVSWIELEII